MLREDRPSEALSAGSAVSLGCQLWRNGAIRGAWPEVRGRARQASPLEPWIEMTAGGCHLTPTALSCLQAGRLVVTQILRLAPCALFADGSGPYLP